MMRTLRYSPNIEARPSARFYQSLCGDSSVSGVIPVRAFLVGGSNQSNNMGDGRQTDFGEEVYSQLKGGCDVRVYQDLEQGHFLVVRNKDDEELASFTFRMGARNSLPREEAKQRAEEYANGYVAGYNDGLEDK